MQPLRHSYTNDTRGDGHVVVKRYEGPDAVARRDRERLMLARLGGLLPVPALVDVDASDELRMKFVEGVHSQDLIEAGMAGPVLRACGKMLRHVHDLAVAEVFPAKPHPVGAVLFHGDYGPNNVLLDPATFVVTAVLDWEWAHPGDAVEDLAWCEWIVRMHHSSHVQVLDELFDAYGWRPSWERRQAADGRPQWWHSVSVCWTHPVDGMPRRRGFGSNAWGAGGDVEISFGGWQGNKLGPNCADANALAGAYQTVINAYGLSYLDVDIENTDEFENAAV